jgi:hypothetical protein
MRLWWCSGVVGSLPFFFFPAWPCGGSVHHQSTLIHQIDGRVLQFTCDSFSQRTSISSFGVNGLICLQKKDETEMHHPEVDDDDLEHDNKHSMMALSSMAMNMPLGMSLGMPMPMPMQMQMQMPLPIPMPFSSSYPHYADEEDAHHGNHPGHSEHSSQHHDEDEEDMDQAPQYYGQIPQPRGVFAASAEFSTNSRRTAHNSLSPRR